MLLTDITYSNKLKAFNSSLPFIDVLKQLLQTNDSAKRQSKNFDSYIINYITKGDTVINIGRHSLSYAFKLKKALGKNGKLVLFETDHKKLLQLIWLQKWIGEKRINLQHAASLQSKTAAIIPLNNYHQNTNRYNTPPCTIDALCNGTNLRPKLIRINTAVNNNQILQGAIETIKSIKPSIIVRCNETCIGRDKVLQTFKFFTALNYRGYFMLDTLKIPLQNFDFNLYQNNYSNFFCDQFVFEAQ